MNLKTSFSANVSMVFLLGITVLASTVYYISNKALEKIDYESRLTQITYMDIK